MQTQDMSVLYQSNCSRNYNN